MCISVLIVAQSASGKPLGGVCSLKTAQNEVLPYCFDLLLIAFKV